jgi:hypothetical protein
MQVCMFCREKFYNYGFGGIFCSTSCESAYEKIQRDQIEQIERLREANRPNSYQQSSGSSYPSSYSGGSSSSSGGDIEGCFSAIGELFSLIGTLIYGLFLFGIMFSVCLLFPPLFFVLGAFFLYVIVAAIAIK